MWLFSLQKKNKEYYKNQLYQKIPYLILSAVLEVILFCTFLNTSEGVNKIVTFILLFLFFIIFLIFLYYTSYHWHRYYYYHMFVRNNGTRSFKIYAIIDNIIVYIIIILSFIFAGYIISKI